MRRVLVVTWALGTATGVLLGLFGVQLVSSRFSTAGVSPMSRPEVLRALQAARSLPAAARAALPDHSSPDTAVPPPSPPTDAAPARPSAGATSSPAPAPPASTLPRPGATAGNLVEAAAAPSTTVTAPPDTSTTTSTAAPVDDSKSKSKSDKGSKGSDGQSGPSSSTTSSSSKKAITTTTAPTAPSRPSPPPSQASSDTRSISSTGGVVAVRYWGGNVQLKWARPNPGYQVYVRSNGPDEVIVYFYTKNHVSQVAAYYNGSTPASDVQEYSTSNQGGRH
ncbi:MAG TPA: hypothetical protein VK848_05820 [Acidimicrobiia bacterium]|nr:hypothetical protein [Acidimicrobiia bacterium]